MLFCTDMEGVWEQTHVRHYELDRRCKLEEVGFTDVGPENKPLSLQETYEAKRHNSYSDRQRKEDKMKQMFVQQVKEKEAILREAERELQGNLSTLRVHRKMNGAWRKEKTFRRRNNLSQKKAETQVYQN